MAIGHTADWLASAEQTLASIAIPPALPRGATPIRWADFGHGDGIAPHSAAYADDQTVSLSLELGRARLDPTEAAALRKGSVIPLDGAAGALVELHADGRLIARCESLVLDGHMAFRVVELYDPKDARECR